jgi:hypothetical protein
MYIRGYFVGLIIFVTCCGMERRETDTEEQNVSSGMRASEQKKEYLTMTSSQRNHYQKEGVLKIVEKKDEKRRSCENIFSKK